MLKTGGRSATAVPQGVLYGSSKAHQTVRELLIENDAGTKAMRHVPFRA